MRTPVTMLRAKVAAAYMAFVCAAIASLLNVVDGNFNAAIWAFCAAVWTFAYHFKGTGK